MMSQQQKANIKKHIRCSVGIGILALLLSCALFSLSFSMTVIVGFALYGAQFIYLFKVMKTFECSRRNMLGIYFKVSLLYHMAALLILFLYILILPSGYPGQHIVRSFWAFFWVFGKDALSALFLSIFFMVCLTIVNWFLAYLISFTAFAQDVMLGDEDNSELRKLKIRRFVWDSLIGFKLPSSLIISLLFSIVYFSILGEGSSYAISTLTLPSYIVSLVFFFIFMVKHLRKLVFSLCDVNMLQSYISKVYGVYFFIQILLYALNQFSAHPALSHWYVGLSLSTFWLVRAMPAKILREKEMKKAPGLAKS